jgi:hypothetical protein
MTTSGPPGTVRSGTTVMYGAGNDVGVGEGAPGVGVAGIWHAVSSAATIAPVTTFLNSCRFNIVILIPLHVRASEAHFLHFIVRGRC